MLHPVESFFVTEAGKKSHAFTVNLIIVAIIVILAILYIATRGILSTHELCYRTWIIEGVREESYGFESYDVYYYYEQVAFFLKKPYEPLSYVLQQWTSKYLINSTKACGEYPCVFMLYKEKC